MTRILLTNDDGIHSRGLTKLEEALKQVKEGGAEVIGDIEKMEYGSFGWFMDPDGNKVELWEPMK